MIKSATGFTLIELLVVIAIMGIIGGMAPVFYSRFLLQNAVSNTVDQISGSLRKAQINAMMSKQGDSWSVNYSSNTITLYKGNSFASRDADFDEIFSVPPSVSVSGLTDLNFSRLNGLPAPATATITVSSATGSEIVTVNNQGVVNK